TRSTKTSDGLTTIQAQFNNLGREIEKVNEKVYAAQVGCKQCKGPHYTKDCPLKEEDKTVKYPKGIVENVLVGIGKFVLPVDFIILDMPEDVKVPLILERSFLSTAHAKIDVFKRKITLKGFIRFLLKVVDLLYFLRSTSREFYNSIIKEKVKYKRKNIVGTLMNVPIFVGNFSVVSHFVVVENMDGYRDQDMGDIILGEPFCKASCVEARKFDGLITIYNGSDNVTYQMA
nr:hypothetical protein [Tanacetum cinerariifolium]